MCWIYELDEVKRECWCSVRNKNNACVGDLELLTIVTEQRKNSFFLFLILCFVKTTAISET